MTWAVSIPHDSHRRTTGPPAEAASVEKLVNDVLEVVESEPAKEADRAAAIEVHLNIGRKVDRMLGGLDWSDFERREFGGG